MLMGAVMGFWAVAARAGPDAHRARARRRSRRRLAGAVMAPIHAFLVHHAAREPDRLRPRADDLRRRPRAVRVPRQRPRPRGRPAEAPVRADRRLRARGPAGVRARSSSTSPRSSMRRGVLHRRDRASTSRARGRGSTCARSARRRPRRTRWAINVSALPLRARARSAARSRASAGACFSLAITPGWTSGDSLVGGAGWIAIALVIFAFWRAELCLVGAYFFGGVLRRCPPRSRPGLG